MLSFPNAVAKCPDQSNAMDKGFILVYSSRVQTITAGKSEQDELEAHNTHKHKAETGIQSSALAFSPFIQSMTSAREWCCP